MWHRRRKTIGFLKTRLDILVAEQGLAESREQAQRLIRAGRITVNGRVADKPGVSFDPRCAVALSGPASRFVSRGGEKLQAALEAFGLSPQDQVCLDVGASTGGFTDCLLQGGARRVYAVDVGRAQLHEKLRADERVVVLEGVNARGLPPEMIGGQIEFCTADVSFISLLKVMPAVCAVLGEGATAVLLIKPQFEAGARYVRKGGVVRDPQVHRAVLRQVIQGLGEIGFEWRGLIVSPLRGPAGNREYLAWVRYQPGAGGESPGLDEAIDLAVAAAFADERG